MNISKSKNVKTCLLCSNRSNVTDCHTNDPLQRITYHKLPLAVARRDRWLEFCGQTRESIASVGCKFICSNHFEAHCFERNLRSELLDGIKRMVLKKDAIPTVRTNEPQLTRTAEAQPSDEEERRRRKLVVDKLLTGEIAATTPIVNPFRKHICEDRPKAKRKATPLPIVNGADGPTLIGNGADGPELIRMLSRMSEPEMLQRIAQLELENSQQGKLIAQLQRTIDQKCEKLTLAKTEMVNIAISLQEIKEHENRHVSARLKELLAERFTEAQLAIIMGGSAENAPSTLVERRWHDDDLAKSLELRCISEEALQYVRQRLHYPLPDGPEIEQWIHGVYLEAGPRTTAFRLLKLRAASLNPTELICCLNVVRTDTPVQYQYNRRRDQIFGPNAQLHCVAVQGIFSEWVQIVHLDFDLSYSQPFLEDIIVKLHQVGYRVVALTTGCDQDMADVWKELGVSNEQHFMWHPTTGDPVYVFACPERILSAIHRNLVEDGFLLQHNNVAITKDVLERLVQSVDPRIVRMLRIDQRHLSSKVLGDPFNVSASRELISHATSNALKILANEDDALASTLATLLDICVDWYELCVTSSSTANIRDQHHPTAAITCLPYGANEDEQNIVLDGMYDVMENLRCLNEDNNYLPQCILISINSMRELLADLRREYPGQINEIPMQRLGSTPMNPTLINLRTELKKATCKRTLSVNEVLGHLCQAVVSDRQSSIVSNRLLQLSQRSHKLPLETIRRPEEPIDSDVRGVTEQNACHFLTHFIAIRLGHRYEYLGERTVEIELKNDQYVVRPANEQTRGTVEPSALWTDQAKQLETYVSGALQAGKKALVENLVNSIHKRHPRMGRDLVEMYVVRRIAIKLQNLNNPEA